eukprot:CAMPEP_0182570580 /NCGR_PEP_ID=MMETSP1324-20130603/10853_1 /TAXON_ID=236786 /ORGANISM="Florenciella sp., Strain RCC1587" /LENGTH=173 /DNA_ID=CAMNT_0024784993 /DNA_START=63 /DNA_END=584 /DNA_ORIENTATION=+
MIRGLVSRATGLAAVRATSRAASATALATAPSATGGTSAMMRHVPPSIVTAMGTQSRGYTSSTPRAVTVVFVEACDGTRHEVEAEVGSSLLDVAHDNDIELEGACGGELACSTCHVVLSEEWFEKVGELSPVSEEEEDMLDLAWGLTDTSRLGCQITVTEALDGIELIIPDED